MWNLLHPVRTLLWNRLLLQCNRCGACTTEDSCGAFDAKRLFILCDGPLSRNDLSTVRETEAGLTRIFHETLYYE